MDLFRARPLCTLRENERDARRSPVHLIRRSPVFSGEARAVVRGPCSVPGCGMPDGDRPFRTLSDPRQGATGAVEQPLEPEVAELLLDAVGAEAGGEVVEVDAVERLVLVDAGEDDGLLAGDGVAVLL